MFKSYIFIMLTFSTSYPTKTNIIRIDSVFEYKYKNKYYISDIRPHSIRFRPCLRDVHTPELLTLLGARAVAG